MVAVDLSTDRAGAVRTLLLDPLRRGAHQPDSVGGGAPVVDGALPVGLRAAGMVALVDASSLEVRSYSVLALPTSFNPANCAGCAIHGVAVRPS